MNITNKSIKSPLVICKKCRGLGYTEKYYFHYYGAIVNDKIKEPCNSYLGRGERFI